MKRSATRFVGAISIAALVWVLLVLPGLRSLATTNPTARETNLAVAAVDGRFDVAEFRAVTHGVDPISDKPVRTYFRVNLGNRILDDKAAMSRVLRQAGEPRFSIVLAGPAARGLTDCNDEGVEISAPSYSDLSPNEQRAVISYLLNSQPQSESGTSPDASKDPAEAITLANSLEFVRLSPSELFPYKTPEETTIAGQSVSFRGYYNYFTCEIEGMWRDAGPERVFSFPGIGATSTTSPGRSALIHVSRQVDTLVGPGANLSLAQGQGERSYSEVIRYNEESGVNELDGTPSTSVTAVKIPFRLDDRERERDRDLFLAGIGVSVIATLILGMLKAAATIVAQRTSDPGTP